MKRLFLGPFIAKVTLEAYNCGSTDFVESEYPDKLVCQEGATPGQFFSFESQIFIVQF